MMAVDIWKYELGQLTSYFIKKKSHASTIQTIIKKINFIDPKIKARIIKMYMVRQNLLHTIRFLQWLVTNRKDILTSEQVSKIRRFIALD